MQDLPDIPPLVAGKAPADTRVVVAMSGGVDSSVVAALLHAHGYDVVGMTLQLYDAGEAAARKGACCAGQDIYDASEVARTSGFPHYVLDYEDRFREQVIEPFAASYVEGETPIPCVTCNQTVKFADLLAQAKALDADVLATGHYIVRDEAADGTVALRRPADAAKDQSYFLFATTREQLDFLRFPLGALRKDAVRELAARFGLEVASKADSQDICFVAGGDYADIVRKLRPTAARIGDIVHVDGRVLGRHEGTLGYTIGQRRGLGIGGVAGGGEPLYVVHLDVARARVVVGPREALATHRVSLRDVNWIGPGDIRDASERHVFVKVRSTRPPSAALLRVGEDVTVELLDPESGVAPGQACVFYDGEGDGARVLGGGFIVRGHRSAEAEQQLTALLADGASEAALAG